MIIRSFAYQAALTPKLPDSIQSKVLMTLQQLQQVQHRVRHRQPDHLAIAAVATEQTMRQRQVKCS
jgi:hypothetical protein